MNGVQNRGPLVSAGLVLGVGLGGFVDGILLHQILQWHNMLSAVRVPDNLVNAKVNMFWDGLFHAFTWLTTAVGLGLLWRAGSRADVPWSGRTFVGSMIAGWGLFNVVEGIIDHQILGLHHVRSGEMQFAWDMGFLAFGAAQILVGWAIVRAGRRDERPRGTRPVRLTPRPAH